jgi:hypothetical protein
MEIIIGLLLEGREMLVGRNEYQLTCAALYIAPHLIAIIIGNIGSLA